MWKCKEWWHNELTLGIWCGPLSQHPLSPARHQAHLLIPSTQNNQPGKNKEPRNEIKLSTNHIVLPWMFENKMFKQQSKTFVFQLVMSPSSNEIMSLLLLNSLFLLRLVIISIDIWNLRYRSSLCDRYKLSS